MDINEWIWRNRTSRKAIAKGCGIPYVTLQYLVFKKCSITLENATKIVKFTGGQVTYEDLLKQDEVEGIENVIPYEYSHDSFIENFKKDIKVT